MENSTLLNYAGELVNLWLDTEESDFPLDAEVSHQWILVLGIPKTSYFAKFKSRDELWGRITMLGQLTNAETITGKRIDGTLVEVRLG